MRLHAGQLTYPGHVTRVTRYIFNITKIHILLKYQQGSTDPLILGPCDNIDNIWFGFNHLQMGMEEVEEEWDRVPPGIV